MVIKVLLIDDDNDLLELLAFTLRRCGFRPLLASEADGALEYIKHEKPHVIVLDVDLGRYNGLEVLSTIRSATHAPVLMLSGNSKLITQNQAYELGASEYVVKPVSCEALVSRIRRHVAQGYDVNVEDAAG